MAFLTEQKKISEVIKKTKFDNLDLITSNIDLSLISIEFVILLIIFSSIKKFCPKLFFALITFYLKILLI